MIKNPFPGPKPYRTAEKNSYPGRNELARRLESTILASRCVTVFGPSGSGKSSLLQAQVLPGLEDVDGERARVVCVDGWPENEEPVSWLARELYNDLGFGPVIRTVFEHGQARDVSFRESVLVAAKRAALGSSRLVIVYLDQIEQLLYPNRNVAVTNAFFEALDELAALPLPTMRIVLSLREDYLGKLRDRLRDKRCLFDRGFRIGPLTVGELTESMCAAAAKGEPPQRWSLEDTRQWMMQVRVKGQPETDDAEAQAAFAQIVCRALFAQRARDEVRDDTSKAENIVQHYLESTLADLGDLRPAAERVMEDLVTPDGGRTLRTEEELRHLLHGAHLDTILRTLEEAAILRAAQHQGGRYFELGHDWLSRRLSERRNERRAREAEEQRRRELEMAQRRRIEAQDQTLMAAFLALVGSDPGMALKLLLEVRHPEKYSNWVAFANNALDASAVHRTVPGDHVVFSPDGKRVLVAGDDSTVRIWNVDGRGAPIEFTCSGQAAAWSPDGTRVLLFPYQEKGRIHFVNGDAPVELDDASAEWYDGEFSPDGKHVFARSSKGNVCVFDSAGKLVVHLQNADADTYTTAHFLQRGLRVLTLSDKGTLCVWDAAADWAYRVIDTHDAAICEFVMTRDDQRVIAACGDGLARAFPLDSPAAPMLLGGDEMGPDIHDAVLSADGQCMALHYRDGRIGIFRFDGSQALEIVPQSHVERLSLSPTGEFFAAVQENGLSQIWWLGGQDAPLQLRGHRNPPTDLHWSPDGAFLATTDVLGSVVKLWRTSSFTEGPRRVDGPYPLVHADCNVDKNLLIALHTGHTVTVHSLSKMNPPICTLPVVELTRVACSPAGDRFFGDVRGKEAVYLYSTDGMKPPSVVGNQGTLRYLVVDPADVGNQDTSYFLVFAEWSPDGQRIAIQPSNHKLRIYRADEDAVSIMGEMSLELRAPPVEIQFAGRTMTAFTWFPDGNHVVVAGDDATLSLYPADGQGDPAVLFERTVAIRAMKFDPSGSILAISTTDGSTGILAMASGTWTRLGKGKKPRDLVWSKHGAYLAQTYWDHRIQVFSMNGQRPTLRFDPQAEVVSVSFIDEDRRLLVVLRDGGLRFWQLHIDDLQQSLRSAHADNVPPDVRMMFLGESEEVADYKFRLYESEYGRVFPPEGPMPEE